MTNRHPTTARTFIIASRLEILHTCGNEHILFFSFDWIDRNIQNYDNARLYVIKIYTRNFFYYCLNF